MIRPDLRFEGFDARSWTNLVGLFSPEVIDRARTDGPDSDDPETGKSETTPRRRGTLTIVVHEKGHVLKALHSRRGRVRDLSYEGPEDLPRLCEEYGVHRTIVLREGALEELSERIAVRVSPGEDYLTQCIELMRVFRELEEAGLIRIHPRPFAQVPVPSAATVRRAFDVLLPDDSAALLVLWDQGQPYTSIAIRRRDGAIDRVVGPDLIGRYAGPLGGDFRRDHRVLGQAVSRAVAPLHVGIYTELATARALLRNPDPGAWAKAVAVRDVILHPTPRYVAVALTADAVRAAARVSTRILGGLDLLSPLSPLGHLVRSRVGEIASVTRTLGFNPLELLAAAQRRGQPTESEASPPDDGEEV